MSESLSLLDTHLAGLAAALLPYREAAGKLGRWGGELAWTLGHGGRLLVAGNGGSAAEAQHLAAELVGKLRDDRMPLSAIALCAETSSLTAIGNDYGYEAVFARQVEALGQPGDLLLLFSTSGESENLIRAALVGRQRGLRVVAITGAGPNRLARLADCAVLIPSTDTPLIQEVQMIATHLLCELVEVALADEEGA
jgi:D-sedoheptulose 7-phosphate isomerase